MWVARLLVVMVMAAGARATLSNPNERVVVFVTGVSRSGTSVTTALLHSFGAESLPACVQEERNHPTGRYECPSVMELDRRLTDSAEVPWTTAVFEPLQLSPAALDAAVAEAKTILEEFFGAGIYTLALKDPRMVWTLPVWLRAVDELGAQAVTVMVHRHPVDNALSLEKRGAFSGRHGLLLLARWEGLIGLMLRTACESPHRVLLSYDALNAPSTRNATIDLFFDDLKSTPLFGRLLKTYDVGVLLDSYNEERASPRSANELHVGERLCEDALPHCSEKLPYSTIRTARHLEDRSILSRMCSPEYYDYYYR